MAPAETLQPIRVGLVAGEPLRLEGLALVFESGRAPGQAQLVPVRGTLQELLDDYSTNYLVLDLISAHGSLEILEKIRRARPTIKLIVIGPDGNESFVMDAIIAGARAYLGLSAGPEEIHEALDIVLEGSIWAPRRTLSKLIDRLLSEADISLGISTPHLTAREYQVLELILHARSNREIAQELGIEERTVKAHVGRLMRKTGAENRIELSLLALNGSLGSRSDMSMHSKDLSAIQ
ncbi:MAG: response regulator transcription factor [Acidobacteriota bacterium]|nr:response regulator transcription factor [Acidobacteriota bacterium]